MYNVSRSFLKDSKKKWWSRGELTQAIWSLLLSPFLSPCFLSWVGLSGTPNPKSFIDCPKQAWTSFSKERTPQDSENRGSVPADSVHSRPPLSSSLLSLFLRVQTRCSAPYLRQGGELASAPGPRSGGDTTACFCPGGLQEALCGLFCHRNWPTADGRVKLSLWGERVLEKLSSAKTKIKLSTSTQMHKVSHKKDYEGSTF